MMSSQVAVLFARSDSIYKTLPGCDVWDKDRDAKKWPGGLPVVAHPPCRAWGQLRQFAKPEPGERELAFLAVEAVRKFGGVLEHPSGSVLWVEYGLPSPGQRDDFGGWTLGVNQSDFGHKAKKSTKLYICGCEPSEIPGLPLVMGEAEYVLGRQAGGRRKKELPKSEREKTPPELAVWLCELARRCAH